MLRRLALRPEWQKRLKIVIPKGPRVSAMHVPAYGQIAKADRTAPRLGSQGYRTPRRGLVRRWGITS
jgi:hypothetical protein